MPFLIIFVVIPMLEITAFVYIGGAIGLWTTLGIALCTAILGGLIIKYQGFLTMESMKNALAHGKAPVTEIFDGFFLVASGALLITPGFVTDAIGFLLLFPPFRSVIRDMISKRFKMYDMQSYPPHNANHPHDPTIIEGDFERVDEDKKD